MKLRQAKKIINREARKGIYGYYGWLMGSPQWNKAVVTYIHHAKKSNPKFYETRGIIRELRKMYEKRDIKRK